MAGSLTKSIKWNHYVLLTTLTSPKVELSDHARDTVGLGPLVWSVLGRSKIVWKHAFKEDSFQGSGNYSSL